MGRDFSNSVSYVAVWRDPKSLSATCTTQSMTSWGNILLVLAVHDAIIRWVTSSCCVIPENSVGHLHHDFEARMTLLRHDDIGISRTVTLEYQGQSDILNIKDTDIWNINDILRGKIKFDLKS